MLDWCGTINIRFDLQLNSGIVPPYLYKVSLIKTTVCGAVNVFVALFFGYYTESGCRRYFVICGAVSFWL